MARHLYTLIYSLFLPIIVARLWWRGRANPGYRQRVAERFGFLPHRPRPGGLWVHAVSVGETLAAAQFVKQFMVQNPDTPVIITSTTPTGSEQVKRIFGERVFHMYLPYDLPSFINRFIKSIRPGALVIVETELWPNLLACCDQHDLPVVLANARMSERSARGYGKVPALTRPMLHSLNIVAVQNPTDGQRFIELGLPTGRLKVTGSVKFDVTLPEGCHQNGTDLREQWGVSRPVLALASSHPTEDEQLLDIYPALEEAVPGLLLLLIPRHPERFEPVTNAARSRHLRVHRRTNGPASNDTQIYVADTMGEMLNMLAAADVVVMGGSLYSGGGGHNPIEPAALGKATLIGADHINFTSIVTELTDAGAMAVCESLPALQEEAIRLLKDSTAREAMGQKGLGVVETNRGAVSQLLELITEKLRKN
ncbi:3-deoxy-D-manno-octulosonic-acid transferase [Thalassolituus maritimus]|uniref:3-deoxy-D-manno-octulosonic acid transferase n=1 Tax=Thalassolituus maritimus TaxID=484498 RepID=A0A1N7JZU7_9GAMM|nr:lipid IV(A) 3-deoxy-D-manno-octulosonic acid transferase [Thalassolituus maritimus]SIS54724.1 3-deoxy-D-manno-octulosonic-acid transferase [Thalassolituus maritimus]